MKVALAIVFAGLAFLCAIFLAVRLQLTSICAFSIFLLAAASIASGFLGDAAVFARLAVAVAWISSLFVATGFLSFDSRFAIISGLIVAGLLPSVSRLPPEGGKLWSKLLVIAWALVTGIFLLTLGYARNQSPKFSEGLVVCGAALVWSRFWFRMPAGCIQLVHTALLLMLGLPVCSFASFVMVQDRSTSQAVQNVAMARDLPFDFWTWRRVGRPRVGIPSALEERQQQSAQQQTSSASTGIGSAAGAAAQH